MIVELGHFALILALILSLAQTALGFAGAAAGRLPAMRAAGNAALAQFGALAVAYGALTYAYVVSDFSVLNVVLNSHSDKPMLYKVSGVWGNHEGSMLLWVLVLALFGAAVALLGQRLPETLRARVIGVQGLIGLAFVAFIVFTSNPFIRVFPAPLDGEDLNPLLQDPGLAFHPPLLYLGYVGLSVSFAFAVAALIEGRVDAAWARWVRPWTLASWITLTLGIALGSWWAYYELGWGGFWFWDPVENASLMPWLFATALLHSVIVAEKRESLRAWTILLAILAFSFSLLGTFLVRSGVLTSVHAFANDPERGVFILGILALTVGGSLALFAWRAHGLAARGVFAPVSRETALLLNNVLMTSATAAVLIGTLYPIAMEAVGAPPVSVGPPYFNLTVGLIFAPVLALAPLGPLLAWKRADLGRAIARIWPAAAFAAFLGAAVFAYVGDARILPALGLGVAAWLVLGALADLAERTGIGRAAPAAIWARIRGLPSSQWGVALAHGGVGIMLAGIVGVTGYPSESIVALKPGDRTEVAGYEVVLERVETVRGPNYIAEVASLFISRDGEAVGRLHPERRFYPVAETVTTEAAIRIERLSDLYAAFGEREASGAWPFRIYHHPLAPLIFIGATIMALGGLASLADRRYRVGAASRRRRVSAGAAALPAE